MKKVLTMALCCVLILGLFASCNNATDDASVAPGSGDQQSSQTPAPSAKPSENPSEEPSDNVAQYPLVADYGMYELSYWFPIGPSVTTMITSYDDIDANAELERRTGVKILWQNPSVIQQAEQYNLMAASGTFTDLVAHRFGTSYASGPDAAVNDGVYYRLNELIEEYAPNYSAILRNDNEAYKNTITDEGNQWGMYCYYKNALVSFGVSYRKDIASKIGITKTPETFDEWEEAFKVFIENGYNEPLFIQNGTNDHATWISAFGIGNSFYQDNGIVKYGPIQAGFKDYLSKMNDWYKKGYITKDFVGLDTRELLILDKAFVSWASDSLSGNELVASGVVSNPEFFLQPAPHPVLNKGDEIHYRAVPTTSGQPTAISTNCKIPEVAVKWLDYMFSEEGQFFCNYGVEGVTHTMESNKPVYTELITNNVVSITNTLESFLILCCTVNFNASIEFSPSKLLCNEVWKNASADQVMPSSITLNANEGSRYSAIMTDIGTYVSENIPKFIMGSRSLDEFDAYVAEIRGMGIDEAVAIQQAALDRYKVR